MAKYEQLISFLNELLDDTSVPKNVRASMARAKESLEKEDELGASGAIYALEEVSNDINLPMHARTMIWNIMSELESIKNE
ncbi:hypothetical protein AUJ14_00345 [Candidatus Micrarchaeota archaeon CG1_02_55_22]|nr:MAG: hypothetical protein AUJ14_00345 [Candidatus Micrarchaeota archaeon CG1_02_55_22]